MKKIFSLFCQALEWVGGLVMGVFIAVVFFVEKYRS